MEHVEWPILNHTIMFKKRRRLKYLKAQLSVYKQIIAFCIQQGDINEKNKAWINLANKYGNKYRSTQKAINKINKL
jgi:hypothetical protein